jgi:hypothetical protein
MVPMRSFQESAILRQLTPGHHYEAKGLQRALRKNGLALRVQENEEYSLLRWLASKDVIFRGAFCLSAWVSDEFSYHQM